MNSNTNKIKKNLIVNKKIKCFILSYNKILKIIKNNNKNNNNKNNNNHNNQMCKKGKNNMISLLLKN